MRFVLYNLRYATGPKMPPYVRNSSHNLGRIIAFLRELEPDLVGLVEVDQGSYRSRSANQVELLAAALGHYHSYSVKYDQASFWRRIPVIREQGNAFLARDRIRNETFHYFKHGMKRLVIELEFEHLVIYLVHLALGARARHRQLVDLYDLVRGTDKPCVVSGDFNMLWGDREIDLFLAATGLRNANREGLATFPSNNPQRHLDFVLHSDDILVRDFRVPRVTYSDHLPIVVDFDVAVEQERRSKERPPHCYCRTDDPLYRALEGY